MLASSKPIHCFSPLSGKLDVGWPRIEDFQLRGHSCVNNVQRCLCHFYTWMRHSKQTATLLLTKRHANFDTSTSAKGYARVYELRMRNCSPWHTACSGSPHNALHSSSYILCVVRRAAYPKLIQFNARNVNKIRIVQTPRVLQWSRTAILQQESPSHHGTEKTDCSVEESERELVVPLKPLNRERNG